MKELKVVVKNAGERPQEKVIEDSLEGLQNIVGGYIEVTMITKDIFLVLNEEGKINSSPQNFTIVTFEEQGEVFKNQTHDIICGNCFFVASKGEEFDSLSEEQSYFIQSQFNLDGTIFAIDRKEVGI